MEQSLRDGGLVWRVLGAWADLRGAMRLELDRDPSEGRLVFYAVLSQVVWLVGRLMDLAYGPLAPEVHSDVFALRAAGNTASLFFGVLMLYGVAALAHAIARALGGTGSWRDSRAAMFWAALVAALPTLAAHLLALIAFGVPGRPQQVAGMAGALILGYVLARCIAEAHGFAGFWRGFAVVLGMAAVVVGLVLGFAAVTAVV